MRCGKAGGKGEGEGEGEGDGVAPAQPTFRVRRWTDHELDAPECVCVTLVYTRPRLW